MKKPICPLCRARGTLTDEDVVPTWLRRHLITKFGYETVNAPSRIKTRVCKRCNERLGARFEQTAAPLIKPLVEGQDVELRPLDQTRIGAWATKTNLLSNFMASRDGYWGREPSRLMLLEMMASGLPPVQTLVRIGCVTDEDREDADPSRKELSRVIPVDQIPRHAFFGLTTVGHLVFEVVTGPASHVRTLTAWADDHARPLYRVWPPQRKTIRLQPSERLDRALIEPMRAAFQNAALPNLPLAPPMRKQW